MELTDEEIDAWDAQFSKDMEEALKELDEALTEKLSSCAPETELQTFVIETLKNRELINTNFKSKLDKVTLLEFIEYLISFESTRKSFLVIPVPKRHKDILPYALERLYSGCHELIGYIQKGVYLYQSPSHESPPISDTDKRYQQILTWKPFLVAKDETTAPELSSIQAYTPCDFRSLYVSRSGLNQTRLFGSNSTNETDHELNVRKKAYRSYLEYGLPDFGDITSENPDNPTIKEKRNLVLRGWMAANKYNIDDQIIGYTIKELWRELEQFCPDIFSPSVTNETVRKFTKGIS